jgi:hypothetical protein
VLLDVVVVLAIEAQLRLGERIRPTQLPDARLLLGAFAARRTDGRGQASSLGATRDAEHRERHAESQGLSDHSQPIKPT